MGYRRPTRWYPREDKRSRGGPQKMRWEDDIRQVEGVMWNRVAPERYEWKRFEEAKRLANRSAEIKQIPME
ncbi:unnamed protein product [Pieris macdunnoughi]|uniref:Uncharacterized protein n=1 Tax=Pieris macdunnoughi TaxID=345717 RepID=A0A821X3R4_9NEOP|nr:unnamed protein product [Pieris macdunnoughi]